MEVTEENSVVLIAVWAIK